MKRIIAICALALVASAASASETVNFDGCEGRLVAGTNYYNLVDPRCKTETEKFASTEAEKNKKAREEAAKH